ncbi:beta-glucosidase [Sphingorhabdus lutea]|uniref:Beta-D-glucoside glucohydrolase n=1 Tax=Sphingorhabdus lutea TaxID=1913578 RepID=A0A1L3J9R4_9SPHN|nr:glycoside hydrolase family 3 N-terminal domain-containing protein [Sphingorhabdus lutea]APG61865.1 beta-glucosidase [Sphingorhabdus lutea]
MIKKPWKFALLLASTTMTLPLSAAPAAAYGGAYQGTQDRAQIETQADPQAAPLYKNANADVDARVEDLLSRMTLEEKVAQTMTIWQQKSEIFDAKNEFDGQKFAEKFPHGIGQFTRPGDDKGPASPRVSAWRDEEGTVRLVNAVQKHAMENTRLGIPVLMHEEGLHGYAAINATSFPQAIAIASSWDPSLVKQINATIAGQIRARGVSLALSPVVDVARDPRWGRIEETFGEDPYLAGEMGVAAVQGLQGESKDGKLPDGHVFATLKHMTGHGQPESGTNVGPANISQRTLREYFFPPFEQVVKRTNIAAVMASYNEIDGVPSHANKWLLGDVLRGEWGFKGMVVSDYFAIDEMVTRHKIAANNAEAAILALNAGVDTDLPNGASYEFLVKLVREGKVKESAVDMAVRRMLRLKFNAGLFENPYGDAQKAKAASHDPAAVQLALLAAEKSVVLLKNDGILPLSMPAKGAKKPNIAIVGPSANVARLGGYYGIPIKKVSLLEGMREKIGDRANIIFAQGVKITEDDDWYGDEVKLADPAENHKLIAEAVEKAKNADKIILTLGDTEQTSREGWAENHLGDRPSLELVGEQQALFDALKALGKPIIVVLVNGRPPAIEKISKEANAIVESWYLGEQGGNALANILFGDVNPAGKLPVTFARSAGQLPYFYNHKPTARRGYLFADSSPLYPFGFGLSYTNFDIGAPILSADNIAKDGKVTVTVTVKNTGQRDGDEVVQLYVRDKISSVTRSVMDLKAFQRVSIKAGESKQVNFILGPEAFQMWDINMNRVVEAGEFDIMVGNSSANVKMVTLNVK